jgi:hypothetical protein
MTVHPYQTGPAIVSGSTTVEFAVVCAVFFALLIGAIEFGRLLYYWNSAEEATRVGARVAVVCDQNDSAIKQRMTQIFPGLPLSEILVSYEPSGCTPNDCQRVTVSLAGVIPIATFIPFLSLSLTLPPATTSLPRESMNSMGGTNPVCS